MTLSRPQNGTLVDLLDRVLDKGLVLQADLVVSLAGVPLIGVCLRAAVAGMETMIRYGLMTDMDAKIRLSSGALSKRPSVGLTGGEQILYKGLGACRYERGLYQTWQYGHVYITSQRFLLHQEIFDKLLLHLPLEDISFVSLVPGDEDKGKELILKLKSGDSQSLRSSNPSALVSAVREARSKQGELRRDLMTPPIAA